MLVVELEHESEVELVARWALESVAWLEVMMDGMLDVKLARGLGCELEHALALGLVSESERQLAQRLEYELGLVLGVDLARMSVTALVHRSEGDLGWEMALGWGQDSGHVWVSELAYSLAHMLAAERAQALALELEKELAQE